MTMGISRTLMRNALLRTSVANSDCATMRVLRTRVRPGDSHEDVLQRRPCELELIDRGALRQADEEYLRVPLQADLLHLAEIIDGVHVRHSRQRRDPG